MAKFKRSAQKVATVVYERWSTTKGSNHSDYTENIFIFLKSGHWQEEVVNERSPQGGSTLHVYSHSIKHLLDCTLTMSNRCWDVCQTWASVFRPLSNDQTAICSSLINTQLKKILSTFTLTGIIVNHLATAKCCLKKLIRTVPCHLLELFYIHAKFLRKKYKCLRRGSKTTLKNISEEIGTWSCHIESEQIRFLS